MTPGISVKFYLATDKNEEFEGFQVYCRITIDRIKSEIATGQFFFPKEWNDKAGRPKDEFSLKAKALRDLYDEIRIIVSRLKEEDLPITSKSIKMRLKAGSPRKGVSLVEYFDKFIQHIEKDQVNYRNATVNHYKATLNHLKNFLHTSREYHAEIAVQEVKYDMLKSFHSYMINHTDWNIEKKKLHHNTAMKYHVKLKRVLEEAYKDELINRNPYQHFPITEVHDRKKDRLTIEEVKLLMKADLSSNIKLEVARDMFLFAFYCSMRPSEVLQLTTEHLDRKKDKYYLTYNPEKTKNKGIEKRINLPKVAVEILKKYEAQRKITGFLLPKWNTNSWREQLKILADDLGINKNLTPGIARHSISTILRQKSVPIEHIQTLNAHREIRTTQRYAIRTDEEIETIAHSIDKIFHP